MDGEVKVGRITHYFGKVQVAVIELTDGSLAVGDTVRIKGHTSDFTQRIDSMQIDRVDVPSATKGQAIGVRVAQPARVGDDVFKVPA
jgi:hypothetical protein